ncbi:hypothetical protein MNBD_GAMMA07-505 [hydrothermal vent metagenome]|uniref:CD-NTase-associated protein 12/Pycsar effector protein TIR domain-containing protein n=1 Tax=hydrothermal vent metagenome TaxID=652676 RepID=A0A3B0WZJ0_9ZZZZ
MTKKSTFGDDLEHFVLSIDIVDTDVKNDLLEIIKNYLKSALGIHLIVLHVETRVNDEIGLHTTDWLPTPQDLSVNIKNTNGDYSAQVAMVFDTENPAWIQGEHGKELFAESTYIDRWSNTNSELIPKYLKKTGNNTLTSIIIPVKGSQASKIIGVINFESASYLECTTTIKQELEKLANAIAILYMLNGTFITQKENTKKEISYLGKKSCENVNLLKMISKPKVFIACSANAKQDVMANVINILDKFKEKGTLEYSDWRDMAQPGVIVQHIDEEIKNCLFGICYFSQPIETDNAGCNTYVDNPNVLFESGLVSANCNESAFESLIPIREKSNDLPPFDLAGIRLLEVPRNGEGKLNIDAFTGNLENRIEALLEIQRVF